MQVLQAAVGIKTGFFLTQYFEDMMGAICGTRDGHEMYAAYETAKKVTSA